MALKAAALILLTQGTAILQDDPVGHMLLDNVNLQGPATRAPAAGTCAPTLAHRSHGAKAVYARVGDEACQLRYELHTLLHCGNALQECV